MEISRRDLTIQVWIVFWFKAYLEVPAVKLWLNLKALDHESSLASYRYLAFLAGDGVLDDDQRECVYALTDNEAIDEKVVSKILRTQDIEYARRDPVVSDLCVMRSLTSRLSSSTEA